MAAGDLTTLSRVKAFLKLTTSGDDALLEALITGLSLWAQQRMSRAIATATYTKRFNGTGQASWYFPAGPVTAVGAVVIDGRTLTAETDYWYDERLLTLKNGRFPPGAGNCTVQFTAGFAVTPPALEQAVTELVALVYRERDRIGSSSKTVGQETISFITDSANKRTLEIFDNYTWVAPT